MKKVWLIVGVIIILAGVFLSAMGAVKVSDNLKTVNALSARVTDMSAKLDGFKADIEAMRKRDIARIEAAQSNLFRDTTARIEKMDANLDKIEYARRFLDEYDTMKAELGEINPAPTSIIQRFARLYDLHKSRAAEMVAKYERNRYPQQAKQAMEEAEKALSIARAMWLFAQSEGLDAKEAQIMLSSIERIIERVKLANDEHSYASNRNGN